MRSCRSHLAAIARSWVTITSVVPASRFRSNINDITVRATARHRGGPAPPRSGARATPQRGDRADPRPARRSHATRPASLQPPRHAGVPTRVVVSSWERNGRSWLRPQSVVFTLLAEQVVPRDVAVSSGSFIRALDGVGISEHATRATLSRMVQRDLLERHRRGRRVFFGMTGRCRHVLADGARRVWDIGAVNRDPGTAWTILTFSLPESSQHERHALRSRLSWAGLGSLHGGVWIGPSPPSTIEPVIDELALDDHVHLFRVEADGAGDLAQVAREAFDLDELATGYEQFLADWADQPSDRPAEDPLALTLRLSTEWLQVIGDDPRIPVDLLPAEWPAVRAQDRFRQLHHANARAASRRFDGLLDVITTDSQ